MFANYDESEIGALDCDEIEGEIDTDSQLFKMAAAEFEKERQMVFVKNFPVFTLVLISVTCFPSIPHRFNSSMNRLFSGKTHYRRY